MLSKFSCKFILKGPFNNDSSLIQVMAIYGASLHPNHQWPNSLSIVSGPSELWVVLCGKHLYWICFSGQIEYWLMLVGFHSFSCNDLCINSMTYHMWVFTVMVLCCQFNPIFHEHLSWTTSHYTPCIESISVDSFSSGWCRWVFIHFYVMIYV